MADNFYMPDGQMEDLYNPLTDNIESTATRTLTNPISKTASVQPNTTATLNSQGLNSAEQQMAMQWGSAGGQAAASIAGGVMQSIDNSAARKESRELAEITRKDQLKQEQIDYSFRKKTLEQQNKQFETQKRVEFYNRKFNIWQNAFKRALENQNKARTAAQKLFALQNSVGSKEQVEA